MIHPKILIVEDNKTLADSIGAACEMDSMVPLVVYNGQDALAAFNEHKDLSLIVLDIVLPDINGFDVCRRIREQSKVPILFMTSRNALPDEISGLEMGADGYLKKPVSPRAVVAHVRATLRRVDEWSKQEKSPEEENEKEYKPHPDFTVNDETKTITYRNQPLDLTAEEYMILSTMIQHPRRVFSKDHIMGMVDEDVIILPKSVRMRIGRIRKKLEQIAPGNGLIITCHGLGYKLIK